MSRKSPADRARRIFPWALGACLGLFLYLVGVKPGDVMSYLGVFALGLVGGMVLWEELRDRP